SAAAHSGFNFLSLGNASGNGNGGPQLVALQAVNIPTNTLVARFSYFWGCSIGSDPAGADAFSPVVLSSTSDDFFDQHASANSGYAPASFDFNSLSGQSISFGFAVVALTAGVGTQTFFAVDDVSLTIFTPDDIPPNDNFANATLLTTTTNVSG